jgi:hypothetical protein
MLNALEVVLRETNPLAHELYLGAIENLQKRRAAFLRDLKLESKPTETSNCLENCELRYFWSPSCLGSETWAT